MAPILMLPRRKKKAAAKQGKHFLKGEKKEKSNPLQWNV
jgi:hypothetical protein